MLGADIYVHSQKAIMNVTFMPVHVLDTCVGKSQSYITTDGQ
jgi:hypothetical protein